MRRFFLDREIILSDRPALTGPDVKHIRTVLRLRPGDQILLFDGQGSDYRAKIVSNTPQATTLSILEQLDSVSEAPVRITIGQALLKAGKMDRVVRQITELGVFALIPVMAERSVPKPSPQRWQAKKRRWDTIAWEALKQCGRSETPQMGQAVSFESLAATFKAYDSKIIFHHTGPNIESLPELGDEGEGLTILGLIGPEGGFTADEVELAIQNGFVQVSLGPRILEADTAVVAACALLQYAFGDMKRQRKKP